MTRRRTSSIVQFTRQAHKNGTLHPPHSASQKAPHRSVSVGEATDATESSRALDFFFFFFSSSCVTSKKRGQSATPRTPRTVLTKELQTVKWYQATSLLFILFLLLLFLFLVLAPLCERVSGSVLHMEKGKVRTPRISNDGEDPIIE